MRLVEDEEAFHVWVSWTGTRTGFCRTERWWRSWRGWGCLRPTGIDVKTEPHEVNVYESPSVCAVRPRPQWKGQRLTSQISKRKPSTWCYCWPCLMEWAIFRCRCFLSMIASSILKKAVQWLHYISTCCYNLITLHLNYWFYS